MSKNFWKELAAQWPINALAPMDGYCDSAYRQIVKSIAPNAVVFAEFYSADGLVHSKTLAPTVLPHQKMELPLIFQIFWKDPDTFAEAAKIIEGYWATGVDINMGCPAKKVVKSWHGSALMISRDTAFRIVEKMSQAVKIPVSVKTRLGWEDHTPLLDFCKWLENAGANLISVHGRTYKQAFTGQANWAGIFDLKRHLSIPVLGNGDVLSYDHGIQCIQESHWTEGGVEQLNGWMIGRASFGNPWCFLPGNTKPTLREVLRIMGEHARLLLETKGNKGALEIRKHLVQYLFWFPNVKTYRSRLVQVQSHQDVLDILGDIEREHASLLDVSFHQDPSESLKITWWDA
jgi:tRNA-dihydrouridine synthase B